MHVCVVVVVVVVGGGGGGGGCYILVCTYLFHVMNVMMCTCNNDS